MREQRMTKELFWNHIEQKFPEALKTFKAWIDIYKREVEWDVFFKHIDDYGSSTDFKYHDLPDGMQIGIYLEYTMSTHCPVRFYFHVEHISEIPEFCQLIEDHFYYCETELTRRAETYR